MLHAPEKRAAASKFIYLLFYMHCTPFRFYFDFLFSILALIIADITRKLSTKKAKNSITIKKLKLLTSLRPSVFQHVWQEWTSFGTL